MIVNNVEDEGFPSFTPAFLAKTYILPQPEVSMTTAWVKILKLEYVATTKMMVVEGNNFRHKQYGEYDTSHIRNPYRMIALMLNKNFGKVDGKTYRFGWIPLIYHVAMKGTVFNWDDIVAKNLSTSIAAAQEGLLRGKIDFYMGSFLVDCILCHLPFEKLNCTWKGGKAPIYTAYQVLWAHKYHSYYKLIYEEFFIPLYRLIFLEDCMCLSEGALETIKEHGDYFFYEEGTYLRMYGGTKAPSLILKYTTDYIGHKEAVSNFS